MTLLELMNLWLEKSVKPSKARKTYLCYKDCIKRVCVYDFTLVSKDINEIREYELQDLIFPLGNNYAKSTIHNTRICFKQSFNFATKNKFIDYNPFFQLELPKNASKKIVSALTSSEQKLIEKIAEEDPLGHIYLFLLLTGLRSGELMNLKWSDYNSKTYEITVRKSKTSTGIRVIPLCPEAIFII